MTANPNEALSIDVRVVPRPERHPRIFGMLDSLQPGGTMQITVDHDPLPLYYHIEANFSGRYGWRYIERGPEVWKVEIERLKHEGCNCSCGGEH